MDFNINETQVSFKLTLYEGCKTPNENQSGKKLLHKELLATTI